MFLQYSVCVPGAFAMLPSSNTIILCCRMHFLVASTPEEPFSCAFEVKLSHDFTLIFQYCVNSRKIPSSLCTHPLAWDALLSQGCSFPLQCRVAPREGPVSSSLHCPSGHFSWKEHSISLKWANQMFSFTLRSTGFWWLLCLTWFVWLVFFVVCFFLIACFVCWFGLGFLSAHALVEFF